MNEELTNIQRYCATNKLCINLKKTNFMIISPKRKVLQPIHIGNITETDYIKCLGVYSISISILVRINKLTMLKSKLRKILELSIN
jgi:hypothetical protein